MIRTQVYIPEDLWQKARYYAGLTNKNLSQLLRDGLAISIKNIQKEKQKKSLKNLVGKFNFKGSPAAYKEHNDIYEL